VKSIKSKLEVALIAAALIPIVIMAGYVYLTTSLTLKQSGNENLNRQLMLMAGNVRSVLQHVPGDLTYLRDSASARQFARALVINDEAALSLHGRSLARDFLSLANNRRLYNQIRFIDAKGQERIRVEHNEAEMMSRVLQPEQLRNKAASPYFNAAKELKFGQVYVSGVDLNREDGELEQPLRPTIRYATPVFAVGDRLVGVLIMNVDANAFIAPIKTASSEQGISFSLLNENGFFIAADNSELEWGAPADLATGIKVGQQGGLLAEQVNRVIDATQFDLQDDLAAAVAIYTGPEEKHLLGRLLVKAPKSVVLQLVDSFVISFTVFLLIAVVVVLLLAKMLSGSLTRPISYLAHAADRLSKGEIHDPISVRTNDEIKHLADAFERLRESVRLLMKMQ